MNLLVNYGIKASQVQPIELPVVTDGLMLYLDAGNSFSYPGSGTTWFDISGNNNHATIIDSPPYSTDNGGRFSMSGNDSMSIPSSTDFAINDRTYSYELWVNLSTAMKTTNTYYTIFGANNFENDLFMGVWRSGLRPGGIYSVVEGQQSVGYPQPWEDFTGAWKQLVFVQNGSTGQLYVNGVLNQTVTLSNSLTKTSLALRIGKVGTNVSFIGELAAFAFYNKSLSSTEVQNNYNALKDRFFQSSYTGNQIPWASQGNTVTGQYFTSATAYSLPKYPVGLSVAGLDPTWDNTDFNPDSSVLGFKFAIKMTSNGFPNTNNSCATPAYLLLFSEDKTTGAKYWDWVIGGGGNTPGPNCGFSNVAYPYVESNQNSNGVTFTRTFWSKGSGATSIELTTDGRLIINGVQRRTNMVGLQAQIYAGYDGGNMTGTVEYLEAVE